MGSIDAIVVVPARRHAEVTRDREVEMSSNTPARRRLRRRPLFTLAALALAACSESGPGASGPAPTTGTIQLGVVTTGVGLDDDGYTLTLVGEGSQSIAIDASLSFPDLSPGSYTFELSDLASNCAVVSGSLVVSVTAGQTTQLTIEVECGYFVYVGNIGSDDLTILQTATHEVVETLPIGNVSDDVKATPDGALIYFTQAKSPPPPRDTVGVLSTETREVVAQPLVHNGPWALGMAPDGSEVYVVHLTSGDLSVIEVATQAEVARVPLGAGASPTDIAVSPDGTRGYASLQGGDRVVVVDLEARSVDRQITIADAVSVATSPDGAVLYVGTSTGSLHAVDLGTDAVTDTYDATSYVDDIAVTADGSTVYVALRNLGFLVSVDAAAMEELETVALPDPSRLALTPEEDLLYVTNTSGDAVAAVSTSPLSLITLTPVGNGPRGLAVVPR